MKAFCFVGSNRIDSVGSYMSDLIEKRFEEVGIKSAFFKSKDNIIPFCVGCNSCFDKNCCPSGGIVCNKLKQEMLDSDLIIWISPVYAANVSGAMKNYMDHVTYFTHTMELAGKIGITITVTDSTGSNFVSYYLKKILTFMGCNVIGDYSYIKVEDCDIIKFVDNIIHDIQDAIYMNKQLESNEELEKIFLSSINYFIQYSTEDNKSYEFEYWNKSGLIKCKSFQEVIDIKAQGKMILSDNS